MLPSVLATRYVTPLREGGSLPGLMEADDLGTYVVKFHGAGQGRKALIAEVICAGVARSLGLPVPDLVIVELDIALAAGEPDEEVQALLRASGGRNLGVDFLPGALDFDAGAFDTDPEFAGQVLWFDALVNNVDRTWRNPNVLLWHGRPYLIDHGSTLTFHHTWRDPFATAARPYEAGDHVLLSAAREVPDTSIDTDALRGAIADVPDEWLADEPGFSGPDAVRRAYFDWFAARLDNREVWLAALRAAVVAGPAPRTPRRRKFEWLGDAP